MKSLASLMIAAVLAIALSACGNKEEHRAKTTDELRAEALANSDKNAKLQELLEQQRSTALSNASKNASAYFAANPRFDETWRKMPHTDDQITPACPQGSGWAWINIMKVEGKEVTKKTIWCSTSSESLGCYIEADFKKGPHAAEADGCNATIPHPLKAFK